jgi:hypothetical protein
MQGQKAQPVSSAPTHATPTPAAAAVPSDCPPGEDPETFTKDDSNEESTVPAHWLLPPEHRQSAPHFPPLVSVPLPRPPPLSVPPPGHDFPPGEDASFRAEPLDIPLPPPPPAPPPKPAAADADVPLHHGGALESGVGRKHLVTVALSAEERRRAEQREKTREAREAAEAERRRRLMAAAATAVKQAAPEASGTVPAAPARRAAELRADKARRARTMAAGEEGGAAGAAPAAPAKAPKPEPSESGEVVDSEDEHAPEIQSKPVGRVARQLEGSKGSMRHGVWERRRGGYGLHS